VRAQLHPSRPNDVRILTLMLLLAATIVTQRAETLLRLRSQAYACE